MKATRANASGLAGLKIQSLVPAAVTNTMLKLAVISADSAMQMRDGGDHEATITSYVEALDNGDDDFPAVVVFQEGETYWLADGFLRLEAHRRAGRQEIKADARTGTRRDAILYATGANDKHGLQRTDADKRRAVMTLLTDPEWAAWSDREISRQCHVSATFVGKVRSSVPATTATENSDPSLSTKNSEPQSGQGDPSLSTKNSEGGNAAAPDQERKRTYRHKSGKETTMKTANIGQKKGKKVSYSETVGIPGGEVTVKLDGAAEYPGHEALAAACAAARKLFRQRKDEVA